MDVKLKTKHIIMLSKLVAKMNIKIDFKETDHTKLGGQVITDILQNIYLAEPEFYDLVGSLSGYTPEKVADTEIEELIDVLREVVKRLVNFIKRPASSIT
jgi:hypothetical protein